MVESQFKDYLMTRTTLNQSNASESKNDLQLTKKKKLQANIPTVFNFFPITHYISSFNKSQLLAR